MAPSDERWPREEELEIILTDIAQLIEAEKAKTITVSSLLLLLPDKERERDALKLERACFYKEQKQAEAKGNTSDLTEDEFFALPIGAATRNRPTQHHGRSHPPRRPGQAAVRPRFDRADLALTTKEPRFRPGLHCV